MARPSASVEIGGPAPKGETRVRRAFCSVDNLIERPDEGINTMADVFTDALKRFPNQACVGWRDVIKIHEEEKEVVKVKAGKEEKEIKKWQLFELSNYKYLTYTELEERIREAASGLQNLGLSSETRFNIYSCTSLNWQNMANACFRQNIPFCTAYDTLGEEGLQHSLAEPDVVGIFTNADLLKMLSSVLDRTPTVKFIIYDGEPSEETLNTVRDKLKDRDGAKVLSLEQLRAQGKANPVEPNPPKAQDTACIMYTSGSTGAPKGVVLSHANLVASVGAIKALLGGYLKPGDTYLAYLPLAHILEFIVECTMLYVGVAMGYGKVKTLTQASVRNCDGDIKALRPSIMVGVPAVWELIRKGIVAKINQAGAVKKTLFNGAMTIKRNKIPILSSVVDNVVFKAVKDQTGGRLRLALSGGAALSRQTQEFLDIALVNLLQGYGMTETCGMCAILTPDYMQYSSVGVPVPAIEIKLVDVPEAGYFATNDPPQGEVFIRGPAVTKGYFMRDDLTKEAITDDGWLMTGDVGQWNKDGTLSLVDRKKNLVKLSGGEYIAIERLESVYKSSNLVANICVHAHPDAKQPMAIIVPREDHLKYSAERAGIKTGELEDMVNDPKVLELVTKEVNAVGKKAGFKNLEMLESVLLVHEELAVTAAQKLSRKEIVSKYADDIKKVYM